MSDVLVRGGATAEELAALLAALGRAESAAAPADAYARWRRIRLAALRAGPVRDNSGRGRAGG